jgi:hypothetical protein
MHSQEHQAWQVLSITPQQGAILHAVREPDHPVNILS